MLFKRLVRICRDTPEGGGGGGNPSQQETFSREYVHELREENKAQRLKALENEKKATEAEAVALKIKEDAETSSRQAIADSQMKSDDRVIRAELKALAATAGIKNMEYLKLADISAVTLDADGNVVGADKIVEKMKTDMPDLFGASSTTNVGGKPPKADDQKAKKATEMTPEEYEASKKELLKKK